MLDFLTIWLIFVAVFGWGVAVYAIIEWKRTLDGWEETIGYWSKTIEDWKYFGQKRGE